MIKMLDHDDTSQYLGSTLSTTKTPTIPNPKPHTYIAYYTRPQQPSEATKYQRRHLLNPNPHQSAKTKQLSAAAHLSDGNSASRIQDTKSTRTRYGTTDKTL